MSEQDGNQDRAAGGSRTTAPAGSLHSDPGFGIPGFGAARKSRTGATAPEEDNDDRFYRV
jgi:hypothetical protein